MTNGNNTTTVSINLQANDMLDKLALEHGMSKVGIVSDLVLSMATLDQEQVSTLLSSGAIVLIMLKLGAIIDYPNGMVLKGIYNPLPLVKLIDTTESET